MSVPDDRVHHHMQADGNAPVIGDPLQASIHQLFEAQAARTPHAVALICEGEPWTYQQLNQSANQLAHFLRQQGVTAETLVGLYVKRSPQMIVALLGSLKAGAAYVPLEPTYPQKRLIFMLQDTQVRALLTQSDLVDSLPYHDAAVICLDSDDAVAAAEPVTNPTHQTTPDDLAYVIYTSGSTGRPKGVLGLHRGVVNRLHWMWDTYPFVAGDVCCQKTPLSFVDSVAEIFGPLLRGVPIILIPDEVVRAPYRLVETLATQQVSRLVLVPSLLRAILETDIDLHHQLPHLKLWISSGEALPLALAQQFRRRVPQAQLLNLYGASEIAADATWYDCDANHHTTLNVPIGRPMANTQVYILDPNRNPLPIGESGELYIDGAGLARGYLNRPELTAERFVPNPFSSDPQGRLFKTGDLGRYFPDGNIEYLGRLDHQVKLRGMRIELGEIESVLEHHPDVRQAAVIAQTLSPDHTRLVACIVCHQAQPPVVSDLRRLLARQLPDYMVPSRFKYLDTLPLSANGKVDRLALSTQDLTEPTRDDSDFPSRDQIERQLIEIWERILHVQPIRVTDDFFDLGGHSLLAAVHWY